MKAPDWKGWQRAYVDVLSSPTFNFGLALGALFILIVRWVTTYSAEREALTMGAACGAIIVLGLTDGWKAIKKGRP